ncbi:MAG: hypothetical protein AAF602_08185 [Myxococcota bacterium]
MEVTLVVEATLHRHRADADRAVRIGEQRRGLLDAHREVIAGGCDAYRRREGAAEGVPGQTRAVGEGVEVDWIADARPHQRHELLQPRGRQRIVGGGHHGAPPLAQAQLT